MNWAFSYAEQNDMLTEASYPYKGSDGTCRSETGIAVTKVKSFVNVADNADALLNAVAEGPVSVAIDASGLGFMFYFGGIIRSCGLEIDHAVLVVGYGTDKNIFGETDYSDLAIQSDELQNILLHFKIVLE